MADNNSNEDFAQAHIEFADDTSASSSPVHVYVEDFAQTHVDLDDDISESGCSSMPELELDTPSRTSAISGSPTVPGSPVTALRVVRPYAATVTDEVEEPTADLAPPSTSHVADPNLSEWTNDFTNFDGPHNAKTIKENMKSDNEADKSTGGGMMFGTGVNSGAVPAFAFDFNARAPEPSSEDGIQLQDAPRCVRCHCVQRSAPHVDGVAGRTFLHTSISNRHVPLHVDGPENGIVGDTGADDDDYFSSVPRPKYTRSNVPNNNPGAFPLGSRQAPDHVPNIQMEAPSSTQASISAQAYAQARLLTQQQEQQARLLEQQQQTNARSHLVAHNEALMAQQQAHLLAQQQQTNARSHLAAHNESLRRQVPMMPSGPASSNQVREPNFGVSQQLPAGNQASSNQAGGPNILFPQQLPAGYQAGLSVNPVSYAQELRNLNDDRQRQVLARTQPGLTVNPISYAQQFGHLIGNPQSRANYPNQTFGGQSMYPAAYHNAPAYGSTRSQAQARDPFALANRLIEHDRMIMAQGAGSLEQRVHAVRHLVDGSTFALDLARDTPATDYWSGDRMLAYAPRVGVYGGGNMGYSRAPAIYGGGNMGYSRAPAVYGGRTMGYPPMTDYGLQGSYYMGHPSSGNRINGGNGGVRYGRRYDPAFGYY